MGTKEQRAAIAELILKNLKSEAAARKLQQKLMAMSGLDTSDLATIKEISSDETNHAFKYEAMYQKYTGIAPASDGMQEVISEISINVGRQTYQS